MGAEKKFFNDSDVATYGVTYNLTKARQMLKDAGYRWGKDSMLVDKKGKPFPTMFATCPSGWTDWENTVKIAVDGMRKIGIDVREQFVEEGVWDDNMVKGFFDMTMKCPMEYQYPSLPWSRFQYVMSSASWAPVGEPMYQNWGRYKNPKADSLLDAAMKTEDPAQVAQIYRALNVIFMQEMPVIPLMYRPEFYYEYNQKHWSNFPNAANPYASSQCLMAGSCVRALWEIKPTGK